MIRHASSTPEKNINAAVVIASPGFRQLSDEQLYLGAAKRFLGDIISAA